MRARGLVAGAVALALAGAGAGFVAWRSPASAQSATLERWYTSEHVARGSALFAEHCATCHGERAQGAANWRERGADGKLPPPPLDGTGHAWHHPIQVLGGQIKFGTPAGMGSMQGFGEKVSDDDIAALIAWFQSLWPDRIYEEWYRIQQRAGSG